MKRLVPKICFFLSASAAILLNVSNDERETVLFYAVALLVLALLIVRCDDDMLNITHIPLPNNIFSVVGLLICSGMGCNFYSAWITFEKVKRLSEILGVSDKQFTISLATFLVIIASPAITAIISEFARLIVEQFESGKALTDSRKIGVKKSIAILTGIYLVGISAVIRANFNYVDDVGRVLTGYRGWDDFSRFASNGLATLIHLDNYITDISPLTQLMAVIILALAGVILLYVVYERQSFSIWELIAVVPIGLNPYFLECISYKFDSPFMALSILAAVAPLLLRDCVSWKYILAVVLGNVLVCTTYQAASGIFPMVVVLLSLRMWIKKTSWRKIASFISNSVIGYGIAMVAFRQIIMLPKTTYVSNAVPSVSELFPTLIYNYKKYFSLLSSDYENLWKWVIALLLIAFVMSGMRLSKPKKISTLLFTIVAEVAMFLLCFGLYPVLEDPSFSPRAMYGFGVFIALLCISTAENVQHTTIKLPAMVMSWVFFVFSFTYGNALYVQKTYTDFRIRQVISDLNDMDCFLQENPVTVQISGTIGYAPAVSRMNSDCRILERLIPINFRENWYWGSKQFYGYYGLKNVVRDTSVDLTTYDLPLFKDSMYHTIYSDGYNVLIKLK